MILAARTRASGSALTQRAGLPANHPGELAVLCSRPPGFQGIRNSRRLFIARAAKAAGGRLTAVFVDHCPRSQRRFDAVEDRKLVIRIITKLKTNSAFYSLRLQLAAASPAPLHLYPTAAFSGEQVSRPPSTLSPAHLHEDGGAMGPPFKERECWSAPGFVPIRSGETCSGQRRLVCAGDSLNRYSGRRPGGGFRAFAR